MMLPAVSWLKLGNTTACCCELVLLLMMLLFSKPAFTATPIGKLARDFNPAAVPCVVKFAVSDLLPSMVIVSGFVLPVMLPLQPEKTEPCSGIAVIVTAVPAL
jgi:hypothetical protein